jgi:hypothetical protein
VQPWLWSRSFNVTVEQSTDVTVSLMNPHETRREWMCCANRRFCTLHFGAVSTSLTAEPWQGVVREPPANLSAHPVRITQFYHETRVRTTDVTAMPWASDSTLNFLQCNRRRIYGWNTSHSALFTLGIRLLQSNRSMSYGWNRRLA